jgi:uracil-DNA glycosylase
MVSDRSKKVRLQLLREHVDAIRACRACPDVVGPPVAPPPLTTRVMLIGQAPGVHEARIGRPFAWTAGKTLFGWFAGIGVPEAVFRDAVYMAAVARCFPGKDAGGGSGDRVPDAAEIAACAHHLEREVALVRPDLVIPVGKLAIAQVAPDARQLADVVGKTLRARYHGRDVDVIPLPHPSGASTWHRMQPGKRLLAAALRAIAAHPAWQAIVARPAAPARAGRKAARS